MDHFIWAKGPPYHLTTDTSGIFLGIPDDNLIFCTFPVAPHQSLTPYQPCPRINLPLSPSKNTLGIWSAECHGNHICKITPSTTVSVSYLNPKNPIHKKPSSECFKSSLWTCHRCICYICPRPTCCHTFSAFLSLFPCVCACDDQSGDRCVKVRTKHLIQQSDTFILSSSTSTLPDSSSCYKLFLTRLTNHYHLAFWKLLLVVTQFTPVFPLCFGRSALNPALDSSSSFCLFFPASQSELSLFFLTRFLPGFCLEPTGIWTYPSLKHALPYLLLCLQ